MFARTSRSNSRSDRSLGRAETELQATEEFKTESRAIQKEFVDAQEAVTNAANRRLEELPEELTAEYMNRNRGGPGRGGSARPRGWIPRV